jgi:hypothetical protein
LGRRIHSAFAARSVRLVSLRLDGHPASHSVQPAAQRGFFAKGSRLACQHEEGGLAGILRIVEKQQRPAKDAQHHRTMPFDQDPEGGLLARCDEALRQFVVRQLPVGLHRCHGAKVLQHSV